MRCKAGIVFLLSMLLCAVDARQTSAAQPFWSSTGAYAPKGCGDFFGENNVLTPCVKTGSYVNMRSRMYDDTKRNLQLNVAGVKFAVLRIYHMDTWSFEHEYYVVRKIGNPDILEMNVSRLLYKKKKEGLYVWGDSTLAVTSFGYLYTSAAGDFYRKFDKAGTLVETGDTKGVQAFFVYDAQKRLLAIQDALHQPVYTFIYDGHGKVAQVTDLFGRKVIYHWDHDLLLAVKEQQGASVRYGYNAQGQLARKENKNGLIIDINYYKGGAVKSVVSSDGTGHYFLYKKNYARMTDETGHVKEQWYNEQGDIIQIKENGLPVPLQ